MIIDQRLRQWLLPKGRLAIAEACLIGLVSGLAAVLLKQSVGWLGSWRVYASMQQPPILVLPSVGLGLGLLCGWLLERLGSESAGSGIPQVKAVLAQFPIALNLRVALVKLVASILALSSGLTLGRQGPTVHIGAAVAAQLSQWIPTSPDHRRQMIAAGAGAGLAAGFNAPIAGTLFVVEELLQDLSGLTLGTAILASFIGAVISRLLGGRNLDLNLELTNISSTFFAPEIPFYIVLGLICGFLGALFNNSILSSLAFYKRLSLSLPLRIGLAGFVSGCIIALLPISFRNNSGLREFLITGEASWEFAIIAFMAHFALTIIAYGSGAPGGLFNPALILGSAIGYLVGLSEYHLIEMSLPTSYALAGMGAFFSAVSKAPFTAIVIVFEITTDFNLVLPLMIACVVSYVVADKLAKGSLYQRLLESNGYKLPKEQLKNGALAGLTAADLMQPQVETLSIKITLDEAIQAFSRSPHRGFPVVEDQQLLGIVTQTDLSKATTRQLPGDTQLEEIMTPKPISVGSNASLADVLYLLNRYQLSRLPVTEGRKLLGIITRTDLIRAEANQLTGKTVEIGPQPEPSYVVYQTRSPAVGKGRLLVPLANPQTAEAILQLAAAIARDRNFEIECIQVVLVPRHNSPAETPVKTTKSRRLLRQAERWGRQWDIPIHTQIKVAQDVAQAILETIKERHIDLIVMGWNGSASKSGQILGSVVDTIIERASCDAVLVKLGEKTQHLNNDSGLEDPRNQPIFSTNNNKNNQKKSSNLLQNSQWNRWLIPTAGGPNTQQALELLPALALMSNSPQIKVCQVFNPRILRPDTTTLFQAAFTLGKRINCPVTAIPIKASSIADSVIELTEADNSDVVVLGASREGLLTQVIQGNIPQAIARGCQCHVILVRCALND
ncbi:Cl- channel voltage-gated family protein [Crinalium epipsammum PCC 9333]|uniref:Cl-channel voltage-gated family protein n=1 Tax=Crinalium epipsammum PCC 9333 TaxID=1173022 RepID=K9VWB4_9CYAN|nr:Cl- channel voltage-gated family protein [Crinalium epipsammum PCC 9333]